MKNTFLLILFLVSVFLLYNSTVSCQEKRFTTEGETFFSSPLGEFHSDYNNDIGGSISLGRWISDQLRITLGAGYIAYSTDVFSIPSKQLRYYRSMYVIPLKNRYYVYFNSAKIRPFGTFGFGKSFIRFKYHTAFQNLHHSISTNYVSVYNFDLGFGIDWKINNRFLLITDFRYEKNFSDQKEIELHQTADGFSAVWLGGSDRLKIPYDTECILIKMGFIFNLSK